MRHASSNWAHGTDRQTGLQIRLEDLYSLKEKQTTDNRTLCNCIAKQVSMEFSSRDPHNFSSQRGQLSSRCNRTIVTAKTLFICNVRVRVSCSPILC